MPDDPYTDPVTGVLRNKLGLDTAEELADAEREITHVALILLASPKPIAVSSICYHQVGKDLLGDVVVTAYAT